MMNQLASLIVALSIHSDQLLEQELYTPATLQYEMN